jgi:uncharacterized membrane protein
MLKKIQAGMELFKAGKRVADPVKWKTRQIETTVLVSVLWAAVNALAAFGITIPVDAQVVDAVAVAIIGVVNVVLTVTTTNKIGMHGKPDA